MMAQCLGRGHWQINVQAYLSIGSGLRLPILAPRSLDTKVLRR